MTDTFDYSGLAAHVRAIALPHHASDVLRTRIEAAFVPVDRYIERNRMWAEQVLAANEATAGAEAAEARVAELTAQLAEARESERAAVVAWLRGGFCQKRKHPEDQAYARFIAAAIQAGEHLK